MYVWSGLGAGALGRGAERTSWRQSPGAPKRLRSSFPGQSCFPAIHLSPLSQSPTHATQSWQSSHKGRRVAARALQGRCVRSSRPAPAGALALLATGCGRRDAPPAAGRSPQPLPPVPACARSMRPVASGQSGASASVSTPKPYGDTGRQRAACSVGVSGVALAFWAGVEESVGEERRAAPPTLGALPPTARPERACLRRIPMLSGAQELGCMG